MLVCWSKKGYSAITACQLPSLCSDNSANAFQNMSSRACLWVSWCITIWEFKEFRKRTDFLFIASLKYNIELKKRYYKIVLWKVYLQDQDYFMLTVLCFPKYISSRAHSSGCQHSSSTHQLFKPNVSKEQPIKLNFLAQVVWLYRERS